MVDPSTLCPSCMKPNALQNGTCRFCNKRVPQEIPTGILPPGSVLHGRYLTGLPLGQGGFGITYRAYDLVNDSAVAIKEYYPGANGWCNRAVPEPTVHISETAEFEYGLKHFRGEAEILRILSDIPEIVRCHDVFDEYGTSYYVMELLEGQTLQDYLKSKGKPLSFDQAVKTLMPVILGLHKIHQRNATHRDIKPANIFICNNGLTKILDFGAAAAEGSQFSDSFMPIVSEGYSPPEQNTPSHDKGRQGPWSDIYAVTGTLYRCVTGNRPPSSSERMAGDDISFEGKQFTASQQKAVRKNLSLNPKERCQDIPSFAKELLACMHEKDAQELRTKYPELESKHSKPTREVDPPPAGDPPPTEKKGRKAARQAAAFLTDMLIFQLVPLGTGLRLGTDLPLLLLFGYLTGVAVSGVLTNSKSQGSPGELLFGLQVKSASQEAPDAREALLYSMLRMLWPLKPVDALCYAIERKSIIRKLSGCASVLKADENKPSPQPALTLRITEGIYAGNVIPLPPRIYTFGRYPDVCNLVYPMTYNVVSRVQCVLIVDALNNVFITNRSSQGTMVNGKRLTGEESVRAASGSEIAFGREKMIITSE